MLNDQTYREWTSIFAEGSHFKGDWSEGSKIIFLDPNEDAGMVSKIAENRQYEFISIEHLGVIEDGKENLDDQAWSGAHENYTLKEVDGKTEVIIDIDMIEEYIEMFDDLWPKALEKLKEVAER